MKNFKRIVAIILTAILAICVLPSEFAEAKASKVPAKPTIKVKATKDNTIKVTISKTKNADAYKIYYGRTDDPLGGYYETYLYKNGKKARSLTISNLEAGKYKVFVVPYTEGYYNDSGRYIYGIYGYVSKTKTVKVKNSTKADNKANNVTTPIDLSVLSGLQIGDTFKFGSYEQDNNLKNGKEAIEWIVLRNSNNELFAVSKYALDTKPYNETCGDVTWETCTLRKWLNKDFYNEAFNKSEQKLIKTVTVKNSDHPHYGTEGGNDTQDKIFLLSMDEVQNAQLFVSNYRDDDDACKMCTPTEYTVAKGIEYRYEYSAESRDGTSVGLGEKVCAWLLRSPGDHPYRVEWVHAGGDLDDDLPADGKTKDIMAIVDGRKDDESSNSYLGNSDDINEEIKDMKKRIKENLLDSGEKNVDSLIDDAVFRVIYDDLSAGVRPALVINLNP